MTTPGRLKDRLSLIKAPIGVMAGAAALLGSGACAPARPGAAALAGLSVFLLSAGACSLNNYQDMGYDGQLERTRRRPLPAGRLSGHQALVQAGLLLSAGLAGLLFLSSSAGGALAGLLAVLLYNAAYTPLKKKTLLALVPGVLAGALPPLVGWVAAGGSPWSPRVLYLMSLLAVWQLPHLWLLVLANSADELSGRAPSFLNSLPEAGLRRLILIWIAGFALLTLFLKVFGFINGGFPALLLAGNALALPLVFAAVLHGARPAGYKYLSPYLNASLLGAILLAAIETLK